MKTRSQKSIVMLRGFTCLVAMSCLALLAGLAPTPASAEFEITRFEAPVLDSNGAPELQAGARPFEVRNEIETPVSFAGGLPKPEANIKDVIVDLPRGIVGNPEANPTCDPANFFDVFNPDSGRSLCPLNSVVGQVQVVTTFGPSPDLLPIYNVEAPRDVPAQFAFIVANVPIYLTASIRPNDQGLRITTANTPQALPLVGTNIEFWGVPADPAHDATRGGVFNGADISGSTNATPRPFLWNQSDCASGDQVTTVKLNTWQEPDQWHEASYITPPLTDCESLEFDPTIEIAPTSSAADTPTGYQVDLSVTQNDSVAGRATANLKKAVVTLPEGTAVNPSAANGLDACTEAEIGIGTDSEVACPPASKIGEVTIDTPLLADQMSGGVYLAEQDANPFGSTLAMYMAPKGAGVQLKLPGEISPDPVTGRLTTTFDDNPQLPFTDLKLRLKGGSNAALVNPPTCGNKEYSDELTPWSVADHDNPTADEIAERGGSIGITSGPNGRPCAATEGERPFQPGFTAGVADAVSGAHGPFIFRLTREDGDQEIQSLDMALPSGVTANFSGVPYCSEAALAALADGSVSGTDEVTAPRCAAASRVGSATIAVGAGSAPHYVRTGKAYLAGPYKGAPLSLAVVVPALAGPLDLGVEVVRNALHVDPRTAAISVHSDPFPTILEGIPLRIKDVRVDVDRPDFMLAGTNCEPMSVQATATGASGATADLTNRFQVGDCASLGFSPKLNLSFGNAKKDTKPNAHPALNTKLSFNSGDANISSVEVALPQGVFLDQQRLGQICSRANYAAQSCPEASIVGHAKATTPLLDDPVEGPVYLKASDNTLPDLAADLDGQIDIDLFGRIDQKQNKKGLNQIRNTFDVVPDVPVSDFELTLEGGSEGLLVNSRNICSSKKTQRVSIEMSAHNEMSSSSKPLIGSACKQINQKKAAKLKSKAKKLLKKAKKAENPRKAKKLRKQARKLKKQARKLGR